MSGVKTVSGVEIASGIIAEGSAEGFAEGFAEGMLIAVKTDRGS